MNRKIRRIGLALAAAALVLTGNAETELSGEEILEIEQKLSDYGYFSENADSEFDEQTVEALQNFQLANGLEVTGTADERTVRRIRSEKAVSQAEYLEALAKENREGRDVKSGSSGSRVSAVQKKLKELGFYSGSADGEFGEGTRSAVIWFQTANGLEATGIVDAPTRMRLNGETPVTREAFIEMSCAQMGDTGSNVHAIQKRLLALGYYDGACTGRYGEATQKAVAQFQRINALEETGTADAQTCDCLYSDAAIALRQADALRSGDSGENVQKLNAQLNTLGYPADAESEKYDAVTETAVRLFQMANGLPTSSEADLETVSRLENGQAIGMDRVQDSFAQQVRVQNDSALALLSSVAVHQRGKAFSISDAATNVSFAFVQYVCVSAGIPVTDVGEINALITDPVEDIGALREGEIVAFYPNGDTSLLRQMGVYAGSWRMICVTDAEPWVLECDISQNGGTLCRWKMVEG